MMWCDQHVRIIYVHRRRCWGSGRVAVGMGIPTGFPYGWEWEFSLAYGNSYRNQPPR